jgi:hypothetical protein
LFQPRHCLPCLALLCFALLCPTFALFLSSCYVTALSSVLFEPTLFPCLLSFYTLSLFSVLVPPPCLPASQLCLFWLCPVSVSVSVPLCSAFTLPCSPVLFCSVSVSPDYSVLPHSVSVSPCLCSCLCSVPPCSVCLCFSSVLFVLFCSVFVLFLDYH